MKIARKSQAILCRRTQKIFGKISFQEVVIRFSKWIIAGKTTICWSTFLTPKISKVSSKKIQRFFLIYQCIFILISPNLSNFCSTFHFFKYTLDTHFSNPKNGKTLNFIVSPNYSHSCTPFRFFS